MIILYGSTIFCLIYIILIIILTDNKLHLIYYIDIKMADALIIIDVKVFVFLQPVNKVNEECAKPFKLTVAPRLALSRTEVLADLYKQHTLNNRSH